MRSFCCSFMTLRPVLGPWSPQPSSSTPHLMLQPSTSESGAGWLHPSVWHLPIYFVVSPLALLLQNSFLVPCLGYDVVPFSQRGQSTLVSLNVCVYVERATSLYILWISSLYLILYTPLDWVGPNIFQRIFRDHFVTIWFIKPRLTVRYIKLVIYSVLECGLDRSVYVS
jgi:hypothetical protein